MNEEFVRREIVAAIDEIRKPAPHLLQASVGAARRERHRQGRPRFTVLLATGVAMAVVMGSLGAVLIERASTRHFNAPISAGPPSCVLPVRTDEGTGLLTLPAGTFTATSAAAAQATAYNPRTHTWWATEPEGISPDGRYVALHDNAKGHRATLTLVSVDGAVLYKRDYINLILGWSAQGQLLVSTIDTDKLLSISPETRKDRVIEAPTLEGSYWRFASGNSVWGVTPGRPDDPSHRLEVVRLDLKTGSVDQWYTMPAGSFNEAGGGPILGLSPDGYPVVPQPSSDSRSAVLLLRAPNVATRVLIGSGDEMTPSSFRPLHAISGGSSMWVTTVDGELYSWLAAGEMHLVHVQQGLYIYAFGGVCS